MEEESEMERELVEEDLEDIDDLEEIDQELASGDEEQDDSRKKKAIEIEYEFDNKEAEKV